MASSSTRWKYDVFLSFRGEDVRNKFVSHLYKELNHKGIYTFKDDQRLQRGKSITPELHKAIEESRFAVVVFSKNYADSSWCLDELAHIVKCRETGQITILPVFYDVNPSHVRKQTGVFGAVLFAKHHQSKKLGVWRDALETAAKSSGWNVANGDEAKYIQVIVREIFGKLGDSYSADAENLVGIESRIKEVNSMLSVGSNDVRIVGIWGCGGIGKTTTARAIFDRISDQFEGCSFLHDVRDTEEKHGLVHLQNTLLSNIFMEENLNITNVYAGMDRIRQRLCRKRVLIVLDDVNKGDQLEKLARERDWFGLGSRIIITTRDKHLLDEFEVDGIHEVGFLKDVEAIKVFSQKAFKEGHPKKGYEELSDRVVKYAGGLPLALKVLGSALCHKNKDMWEDALDKLQKRGPGREILDTLKISYEYLDASEKDIFLDIACFFNGQKEDYVTRILDSFGFNPKIGISVLVKKSLISCSENTLGMHHLLQELGWDIVRQESPKELGERSRLFHFDDIKDVLMNNTGTKKVEGILLSYTCTHKIINASADAITKMNRLRFLLIRSVDWFPTCSFDGIAQCFKYLSKELRWLDWEYFPFESMPPSFQADKLVGIRMHESSIVQLWKEKKVLNELKYIDLSDSSELIKTPDFTAAPNLMELVLKRCKNLVEVHSSIGLLKRLVVIDLSDCKNLQILPNSIQSKALKIFNLSGCTNLEKLPEDLEYLECLEELYLCGTAIRELPSSIGNLTSLGQIDLSNCEYLQILPNSIQLKALEIFNLSGCPKLEKLPEELGYLECLKELNLCGTSIRELPSSIGNLTSLVQIDLSDCEYLQILPNSIQLKALEIFNLSGCTKLEKLPEDLAYLECLKVLNLCGTAITGLPSSIGNLTSLVRIDLSNCKYLTSLPSTICMLKHLKELDISFCPNLDRLPDGVGSLECLDVVYLNKMAIRELLPSIVSLYSLRALDLRDCKLLGGCIPSGSLSSLEELALVGSSIVKLPESICELPRLKFLKIQRCKMLEALPKLPSSLTLLCADECTSLKIIYTDRFTMFQNLRTASFTGCVGLLEAANICSILWLHRLQGLSKIENIDFHIWVPGGEIPQWFSNQNIGRRISMKLPQYWYNHKLLGFAICLVFVTSTFSSSCCNFHFIRPNDMTKFPYHFWFWTTVESEHVLMAYIPLSEIFPKDEHNNPKDWCEVEVAFESEVMRCGIRLVYEDDVKPRDVDELWVPSKKRKLHRFI